MKKLVSLLIALAILALGAAGVLGFKFYQAEHRLQTIETDPSGAQQASQAETQKLVEEVGKLIDLPQGETPTVATVTDVSKLKGQEFFQNAKNGDKVLIYSSAKKAILYDPSANKIVDVAPVNIGASSSAQVANIKVDIQNGTTTVGLTNKVEAAAKKADPAIDVLGRENAAKQSYSKTLIIPLSDAGKSAVSALEKALGASSSALPAGEKADDGADILIIAGKDQI